MASGALMTGDQSSGYTLHLRPPDSTSAGAQALRHFMEIVNGPRPGPAEGPQQQRPTTPEQPGLNYDLDRSSAETPRLLFNASPNLSSLSNSSGRK